MSLKVKISSVIYCPRHRGFNPASGESAIKGGCRFCYALLAFWEEVQAFRRRIMEAEKIKKMSV